MSGDQQRIPRRDMVGRDVFAKMVAAARHESAPELMSRFGCTRRLAVSALAAAGRPSINRDAEIASAVASGASVAAVAAVHGLSPARAGQIARAAGVQTRAGRKPTGAATHHTARGRALLARLVELASAAGVEPEVYLEREQ